MCLCLCMQAYANVRQKNYSYLKLRSGAVLTSINHTCPYASTMKSKPKISKTRLDLGIFFATKWITIRDQYKRGMAPMAVGTKLAVALFATSTPTR